MKRVSYKYIQWSAVVVFAYLLFFPISIKIDKVIPAVEVSLGDSSFCKPLNVIIDGTYHWRLIGDDTFDGNIKFDTYPLTMKDGLAQGKGLPTLRFQEGSDHLDYGEWMDSESFGKIHTKAFFNKFIVQIYGNGEGNGVDGARGWSTIDGHCIVAPAHNKEEALSILKRIQNDDLAPYEYWIE